MKQKYTKIFYSSSGAQLRVKFIQNTTNTVEIVAENEEFHQLRRARIKWILCLILVYVMYILVAAQFFVANLVFIASILILTYSVAGLVRFEKVSLVRDFGLQTSTTFAFGKVSSLLIPYNCLENVVINEVIFHLKVIYVLDILTKGSICKEKPIITLFSNLLPNLECLELCYNLMSNIMNDR